MTNGSWDLYRLFFVVAEAGSVNRAAAMLGMSQPTLSRRIGDLERSLGAPLFFRTPSGVRLTQEGEELFSSASAVHATFQSFQREFRGRMAARSSLLKISATEGLTRHWLIPRVPQLRRRFPGLSIHVDASVQQQSLAESDLDFVIRIGDPGELDLVGRRVGEVGFGIFAGASYLARRQPPASLRDLCDHDLVGGAVGASGFKSLRANESAFQRVWEGAVAAAGTRVHPRAAQHAAVAEGLGLSFLATPFAEAEGLIRVLPNEGIFVDLWLLRRRESDLRPLTRAVGRYLEQELAASQAWLAGRPEGTPPVTAVAAGR
ncbi:LysR family transcriptional regulator [Caulobacter sp. KR2-114]|jgi:DNA-binding transcriptional LysR family regulator|uniref:LysR family transcriptional regulator n=1 Tax=Caulobacter sp. KR2-114 TaxID=3400912 RepID=UPI003BFF4C8A